MNPAAPPKPPRTGITALTAQVAGQNQDAITDELLLQICRIRKKDQVAPECMETLRAATRLVIEQRLRQHARVEAAVTLLASALGQLKQYNPAHFPFGYAGGAIHSQGWIERDALERVAKQIVGLMWRHATAEAVAIAVQHAVSESIRLGFLEQREYDAWRPGMRSGSGWRAVISATPYGLTKARSVLEFGGQTARPAPTPPPVPPRCDTPQPVAAGANAVTSPIVGASATPTPNSGSAVQLGRPGEPCIVLGIQKKPLTDGQHAVVSALLKAGDEGLTKDALEAIRPSARRILKTMRADPGWADVIVLPGQTNGRYRVRVHA